MYLVYLIVSTVRVLLVSYAAALSRRLRDEVTLPFSRRITVGSVVLIYSIFIGAIISFAVYSILYYLLPLEN